MQNEIGRLEMIPHDQIPFEIPGCSYSTASFTHVNPAGSRISNGRFGVLYLADRMDTAITEVRHHLERYWSNVPELNYERFVFRGLTASFSDSGMRAATGLPFSDLILPPDGYVHSNRLESKVRRAGYPGLRYHSVRSAGNICWPLMTPRPVTSIIQSAHFEMIWSGYVVGVNQIMSLLSR